MNTPDDQRAILLCLAVEYFSLYLVASLIALAMRERKALQNSSKVEMSPAYHFYHYLDYSNRPNTNTWRNAKLSP